MAETHSDRLARWGVQDLLRCYTGLRLRPSGDGWTVVAGTLTFDAEGPTGERICDQYDVRISVPKRFPSTPPAVWETGDRIPKTYHTFTDGRLCLGSPTTIRLRIFHAPSLKGFVESCVIPYLYSHSYFERHREMPFGELEHGAKGLRQDLVATFKAGDETQIDAFVCVASMKKRHANKKPCPCRSGQRLGVCHRRIVNKLRQQLGRCWFRSVKTSLSSSL